MGVYKLGLETERVKSVKMYFYITSAIDSFPEIHIAPNRMSKVAGSGKVPINYEEETQRKTKNQKG